MYFPSKNEYRILKPVEIRKVERRKMEGMNKFGI
jgi:hypothetical protein